MMTHQYIERYRNRTTDEQLLADHVIRFLYNESREDPNFLQRAAASGAVTDALAHWQFDRQLRTPAQTIEEVAHKLLMRESESLVRFRDMRTLRELFERQIRYWDVRPQPESTAEMTSPADGKLLPFEAFAAHALPIKSKFIRVDALLAHLYPWPRASSDHSEAMKNAYIAPLAGVVVRLTPDVYHYTHAPVSGRVVAHQTLEGSFHSCNPTALIRLPGSYALNRRTVTVYDTDVNEGTGVGLVAQVDVAAMMIGQIESRFSRERYEAPRAVCIGDFVPRGAPVSLFRPGSSTSIVIWQGSRASLNRDLIANSRRHDLSSRFSDWLGQPWVETRVFARQGISKASPH